MRANHEPTRKRYGVPGITVVDAERSQQGYHLNMFCMSLMKADHRAAFKANAAKYLQRFSMSESQRGSAQTRQIASWR